MPAHMSTALLDGDLPGGLSRRRAASLMLGLFLLLQIFAVSDTLHRALHADACSPAHQCAITVLTQGHVASPGFILLLAVAVLGIQLFRASGREIALPSFDYSLAAVRGPPRR